MSDAIHPAIAVGNVAVITGGASGIGLAAAMTLAKHGLKIVLADLGQDRIGHAVETVAACAKGGKSHVLGMEADVSDQKAVEHLRNAALASFGRVDILMNNAGIGLESAFTGPLDNWQRLMDVNLWGVIHMTHAFLPAMIAAGNPGLIINTGSKQGITTPPGNPAYNMSKAAVKVYTEALEHDLRNRPDNRLSAKLLIPGFVFTGMTSGNLAEKPAAAWTAQETVDFMLKSIAHGDFYILCPDNDVPRSLDEKRIAWAAGDIIANRPPLSRWHPHHADAFKASLADKRD
ncbi:MAG: SDR family NAD(P)-dependent oxidoreductase [Rhizobiaceae bacterium]